MTKTVMLMSGGMDSATLLYKLKQEGHDVIPVGINYGQRHSKELEAARMLCEEFDLEYRVIDLTAITPYLTGSSQTDPTVPVPHGHYAEETMKATIVPNRNMMMLSIAGAIAIAEKADFIAYAAHSGDHAIYPDCRPEFALALADAFRSADWHQVKLSAPFIGISKTAIALLGKQLGVPFENTWSCYEGGVLHCGKCGTCVERKEALEGFDPTMYRE